MATRLLWRGAFLVVLGVVISMVFHFVLPQKFELRSLFVRHEVILDAQCLDRSVTDRYCTIYDQIAFVDTSVRLFTIFAISYILLKTWRAFALGRGRLSSSLVNAWSVVISRLDLNWRNDSLIVVAMSLGSYHTGGPS